MSSKALFVSNALRNKCPYSEIFWSVFSLIRTEYEEIRIAWKPVILLKRGSNTSVFLWILRNFKNIYSEEHLRRAASARHLLRLNVSSFLFMNGC